MTAYFHDCRTAAEAKAKYRELAKKLHPDAGGSTADMAELTRQYEAFDESDTIKPNNWGSSSTDWGQSQQYTGRTQSQTNYEQAFRSGDQFRTYGGFAGTHSYTHNQARADINTHIELQRLREEVAALSASNQLLTAKMHQARKEYADMVDRNSWLSTENQRLMTRWFEVSKALGLLKEKLTTQEIAVERRLRDMTLWDYIWFKIRDKE